MVRNNANLVQQDAHRNDGGAPGARQKGSGLRAPFCAGVRSIQGVRSGLIVWCAVLLAACGCSLDSNGSPTPDTAGQGPFVATFRYDPVSQPSIILMVQINGHDPLPFLVDTGLNSPMLIDSRAAHRLNLSPDGDTVTVQPGNQKMQRTPVRAVLPPAAGRTGGLELSSRTAYIGDLEAINSGEDAPAFAGIIGTPMLKSSTWLFDFATRTVVVYPGSATPAPRAGITTLPMKNRYGAYAVRALLSEGLSTDLLVDTGSTDSSISRDSAAALPALPTLPGISTTLGGLDITDEMLLPRIQLGDFIEPDVIVFSTPKTDVPRIGMSLLARFRLTLDFPREQLTLERASDYERHLRLPGASGIQVEQRGERYYIQSVSADSPAAAAGIHVGDRVIAVDGRSLTGNTANQDPDTVQDLLNGFAGVRARVVLVRPDGKRKQVSFDRRNEYAAALDPVAGLALEEQNGPLVVTDVRKGSAGNAQGLREGDQILALDNVPVADMTPSVLGYHLRKPTVALTVLGQNDTAPHKVVLRAIRPAILP